MKKRIIFISLLLIIVLIIILLMVFNQRKTGKVEITDIEISNTEGNAVNEKKPSFNDLTATFNVDLKEASDSLTYLIKVKNNGNSKVKLYNVEMDIANNSNITAEVLGIESGDSLNENEEALIPVKIGYLEDVLEEENGSSKIKVTLIYE